MTAARGTSRAKTGASTSEDEKLLLPVFGNAQKTDYKPVVINVIDALIGSGRLNNIVVLTSRHSPRTRKVLLDTYCKNRTVCITDSGGSGYSVDLGYALNDILRSNYNNNNKDGGTLVVSGDMPLLDSDIVQKVAALYVESAWVSIVASKDYLDRINLNLEYPVAVNGTRCYYTGVSVVDARTTRPCAVQRQRYSILNDYRIVFTLNTRLDYRRYLQ